MATGLRIILRLSLLSTYRSGNFYPTANGVLTVGSQPTGSRNRFQPPVSGKPTFQAESEGRYLSDRETHFCNPACQLTTTVIGGNPPASLLTKKRWPSPV